MKKHRIGEKAKVEIWNYEKKESEFKDCKITGIVFANDRDYRINVELLSGQEIYQCAPECVIK